MDAIPTLKVVAKHGMGVDNIAVDHATEKGILVVNAPFSNLNAVAEHIVMLLLALSKRTVQMDQLTRAGQFKERNTYKTIELKGATVGIIGLLLGDLMMALFDPRINLTKKGGER